jgi:hypothetical protein
MDKKAVKVESMESDGSCCENTIVTLLDAALVFLLLLILEKKEAAKMKTFIAKS